MFGSTIIEIAIGVVFIYLLLSLVVTAANEMLSALIKARGRVLFKGIQNLLPGSDAIRPNAGSPCIDFARAVYDHPLVDGLSQGAHPSYIPSRTFALALLDVIMDSQPGKLTAEGLQAKINALPTSLRKPLNILLSEAENDLERFKMNLEVWFNNAMDRVGGFYKRRVQYVVLGLAAVITVLMNVDTMLLINRLSNDSTLRATLVARAAALKSLPPASDNKDTSPTNPINPEKEFETSLRTLNSLNLPIGWSGPAPQEKPGERGTPPAWKDQVDSDRYWPDFGSISSILAVVRRHFIGWMLTTFAVSLGAPFWFDILNRVVNIRSAGKAPEEEPKKPKDVPHPAAPGGTVASQG